MISPLSSFVIHSHLVSCNPVGCLNLACQHEYLDEEMKCCLWRIAKMEYGLWAFKSKVAILFQLTLCYHVGSMACFHL
jgi:hypothetical protein